MDLSIQMRSADLMVKLVRHDVDDVPLYGYTLQKQPTPHAKCPLPLPRSTPEAEGVSSAAVERFFSEVEANSSLAAHSMIMLRHGKVIAKAGFAPYRADVPHMIYSMSKSVTATAIGMAMDEGILHLDDKLVDIFSEYAGIVNSVTLKSLTLRHLLTMSSGSRFNEVGSALDADWARMFMETLPKFEPGTAFEYNSMNSYMLAAALVRKTGKSVCAFLKPRLFDPLHIEEYTWETCPKGIEKGGWGLSMLIEDCAKIGQLYLNDGVWEGKRLLSSEWVYAATHKQIDTPNGECKDGYGYQIWMNGDDAYQFNGAFGQYVVMLPKLDAVVALFSGSAKLFAEGELNRLIRACLFGAGDALPENRAAHASLENKLESLRFSCGFDESALGVDDAEMQHMADMLSGREYRLQNHTGGLFPFCIQGVHGNFTPGADLLRFGRAKTGLDITVYEGTDCNTLHIAEDGSYTDCRIGIRGERQLVAVRGAWRLTAAGMRLAVFICFLEAPDTRVLDIEIKNERISVAFYEYPTLEASTEMLLELVGLSKAAFFRKLSPALKNVPTGSDKFSTVVRQFMVPSAPGSIIVRN